MPKDPTGDHDVPNDPTLENYILKIQENSFLTLDNLKINLNFDMKICMENFGNSTT